MPLIFQVVSSFQRFRYIQLHPSGLMPLPSVTGTWVIFRANPRHTLNTLQTSSTSPGDVSSTDTSSTQSPTYWDVPWPPFPTSAIATPPSGTAFTNQVSTSPGNNSSTPTMSLSQSCSDDVSTVASSGPSQSPSQANASVNQSGHTVLVGLIVALALVGGLLVTLIVCLILLYLRRIRHHRTSRPLIHPVPSVKEAALSLPGVAGGSTRMASPSVPLSTAVDAGDSGNDSASASAEGSYAQDTNRCESACPLDSQSDTRPGWTYPSSKIGLAL